MMNLNSEEDVASLYHFASMTESAEIASECLRVVARLIAEGTEQVDDPSVIINMAIQSLDPEREKRFHALAGSALISSLASFGRNHS